MHVPCRHDGLCPPPPPPRLQNAVRERERIRHGKELQAAKKKEEELGFKRNVEVW